jgi:hypothetical protein
VKHQAVHDLCAEYGITIIDRHRYPDIGETRAVVTMARIMRRYGEGHLRLVLSTLAETSNNKASLDEVGLWATSDMLRAWAKVVEDRMGDWLAAWDLLPVGQLQYRNQCLSGTVPQRYALGGQLHERLYAVFGPDAAQGDLLDDRRRA